MSAFATKEFKEIPKKYINPLEPKDIGEGRRVNGKEWKIKKDAFRVKTLGVTKLSSWELRERKRQEDKNFKARINDLKQEKDDVKQAKVTELKKRREAKEEKERFARISEKMHKKKVERMKKREKRNKLLKER
ncbi:rRNA-processing protein Cgr1p [[Candida] railenensis]|uniref:rRNA-processing protein n=1 Tax=[Candida] railenensis TaxID=45579 RepID=A0A9P0VYA5_9ASCO|nr:rRNA-processing protein Cgr1p [[Candida] railenensis]